MTQHTTVQGSLVAVHDVGVLIRGASGSGKSLTALNLVGRGHQFVADELVRVTLGPAGKLVGEPLEEEVRIEIRGLGIFKVEALFPGAVRASTPIDFVVHLDAYDPSRDSGRVVPEMSQTSILGHHLETVRLPLPQRMDPAVVIELLARLFKEIGTVKPE